MYSLCHEELTALRRTSINHECSTHGGKIVFKRRTLYGDKRDVWGRFPRENEVSVQEAQSINISHLYHCYHCQIGFKYWLCHFLALQFYPLDPQFPCLKSEDNDTMYPQDCCEVCMRYAIQRTAG